MKRFAFVLLQPLLMLLNGCTATRPGGMAADESPQADIITAKSWAVADGRTGQLLWGFQADQPLKSASTTKMMCAHVVLQLAAKDPAVLEELVTFSKLADDTPGSTADLKAGERILVRECLYGLLLPSGNDAGNALAEHFNSRFAPPAAALLAKGLAHPSLGTRVNFIAEMNRTAQRLGMRHTVYRSPYGDGGTEQDRTSTTRDLTLLAVHALRSPVFRKYVSTQQHEGPVLLPDDSTRRANWTNTNQLLGTGPYDGVKTGTTTQAGFCLVSSGRLGNDHLVIAVLGSTTADGRYQDTRTLFGRAWKRRGH